MPNRAGGEPVIPLRILWLDGAVAADPPTGTPRPHRLREDNEAARTPLWRGRMIGPEGVLTVCVHTFSHRFTGRDTHYAWWWLALTIVALAILALCQPGAVS